MITLRLFEPQAQALLKAAQAALRGRPITHLEAVDRAPLERAVETILAALADSKPNPLDRDLDRLATTLYGLKLGQLRDWAMQRIIRLHRTVELWRAGSELPFEVQGRLLQIQALNTPNWHLQVRQLLEEHGLKFDLPTADDYHLINLPNRHDDEGGGE